DACAIDRFAKRIASPLMRLSIWVSGILALGLISVLGTLAWRQGSSTLAPEAASALPEAAPASSATLIRFEDVAQRAGIHFEHFNGLTEIYYVPQIMGGGVAWLDYDQDGYLDLLLIQGSKFPPDESFSGPTSRLYRNRGDGTF